MELEIRQMLNTTLIDYVLSRYILHFKGQDRFDVVKMRGGGVSWICIWGKYEVMIIIFLQQCLFSLGSSFFIDHRQYSRITLIFSKFCFLLNCLVTMVE